MSRPVVLCFSGHDPSGGAGIQADIETIASHRCHAASVITALTEQDSRNVKKLLPQRPADLVSQAQTVLADIQVAAVKIGLIGSAELAEAIADVLQSCPRIPVVLDPVLAAGGGSDLAGQGLIDAINNRLLPLATVVTPNASEARRLTGLADLDACGKALRHRGAEYVLITGADEDSELVHNRLYLADGVNETFNWERLPYSYHGSGCTLASAIAALLAQGLDPFSAISEAQDYTWQSLAAAYRPGRGQHNPERFFWVES
ncbi:hydroxymethylpyrimidine/phosphomethylpyrimidine kinase [Methylomonas koyamae]|uniref:hydroxymethylpyrimidine kinase n=1 Tax=Methylomonas koyamae TaxID=702114 RepID=A0A177N3S6_9GAMM|nr:hydroxymethylpyrimidine/phosphomethylpyrimidine kinase [Methylomonas koyamae]OAI12324.1 hydroxymethylpyrimidine/phosphomethylpyrimidine kinase [Methylomonas koyamae]